MRDITPPPPAAVATPADLSGKLLTAADFERAAAEINVPVAAVRAAAETESHGSGFLSDGTTPKTLFEAQWFHSLTGGKFHATHPAISAARWDRSLYATGRDADERGFNEHKRLQLAVSCDRNAALQAASWGKFQIMGFNWRIAGCASLQDFVNAMYRSEGAHLDCFINVIRHMRLDDEMREQRWGDFAFIYNGPGYKQNNYAGKMAAAFAKFSQGSAA